MEMPYKNPIKQKEAQQRSYQRHSSKIRERTKIYRKQHKAEVQSWLRSYKSTLKCILCSEQHPACLQFHHRNPSDKSFGVAIAATIGITIPRILEEIAKCDVLCGNCHSKEHYKDVEDVV